MLTFLGTLLSKIKLTHILIIMIIALAIGLTHFRDVAIKNKETAALRLQNFEEILKLQKGKDSMQVVHLQFQKEIEVENYINQNATLKSLLKKQGFENQKDYKKINEMVIATQKYFDSLTHSFNATPLVTNIQNNEDGIVEFSKTGECISYDGTVEFTNGELMVNTFNEAFTGDILLTKSKGKRIKKFLFFRYGPRDDKFTTTTNCGDVSVQIIEKVE